MPYEEQTWVDNDPTLGRVNAARLTHMEQGIGRYSAFLDVDGEFGGGWSGVVAACNEAAASGGPSAVVLLGKGTYDATSTINIAEPDNSFTIQGGGIGSTRIRHSGSFTGPFFQITDMKRNGQWESTVNAAPINTYDHEADDGGMTIRGFSMIDDDRSTPNRHGIYLLDVDDLLMEDIRFGFLTGHALRVGADDADVSIAGVTRGRVRESDFRRVRIYRCGSGSPSGSPDVPALLIQNGPGSQGDGTNQNFFHQLRFVYNEGRLLIRGGSDGSNSLRRTFFRDTQIHALADNSSWTYAGRDGGDWFPFDMVTIQGAVRETMFDGVTINGTYSGAAGFAIVGHQTSTAIADQPKRVVLRNINVVNTEGHLVRVEKLDSLMLDGFGLGSAGLPTVDVLPDAGLQRFHVHEMGANRADVTFSTTGNRCTNANSAVLYHGVKVN